MIDAVIRAGGKQYRVQEGSLLDVPSMDAEPGSSIELRDVLLVSDDGNVTVGSPSVDGAVVVAEVVEHGKGKKVISFKYKAKVRYRRKRGHRQGYTRLSVTSISFGGKTATRSTAASSAAAAPVEAEAEAPAAPRRRRAAATETPAPETAAPNARATRVIEIEGIGEIYAKTLADAGVDTTAELLETAGSAAGRDALAEKSGLDASQILEWVNRADLMRINGVGSEFSDLLEQAGVDTVKELATRVPANLQAKMAEVNEEKKLTRRTPSLSEVESWVAEAKTLPPAVTH